MTECGAHPVPHRGGRVLEKAWTSHWYWVKHFRRARSLACCPVSLAGADGMRRWHVRKAWEERAMRRLLTSSQAREDSPGSMAQA